MAPPQVIRRKAHIYFVQLRVDLLLQKIIKSLEYMYNRKYIFQMYCFSCTHTISLKSLITIHMQRNVVQTSLCNLFPNWNVLLLHRCVALVLALLLSACCTAFTAWSCVNTSTNACCLAPPPVIQLSCLLCLQASRTTKLPQTALFLCKRLPN